MPEATFYEDKLYLPRSIRRRLGLSEGDKVLIDVVERGRARLRVSRGSVDARRILRRLRHPPDLGAMMGPLTREAIYDETA